MGFKLSNPAACGGGGGGVGGGYGVGCFGRQGGDLAPDGSKRALRLRHGIKNGEAGQHGCLAGLFARLWAPCSSAISLPSHP